VVLESAQKYKKRVARDLAKRFHTGGLKKPSATWGNSKRERKRTGELEQAGGGILGYLQGLRGSQKARKNKESPEGAEGEG